MAKGNAPGAGTSTIGVNFQIIEVDELKRRAKNMNMGTSTYIKAIVREFLASGKKLNLKEK